MSRSSFCVKKRVWRKASSGEEDIKKAVGSSLKSKGGKTVVGKKKVGTLCCGLGASRRGEMNPELGHTV